MEHNAALEALEKPAIENGVSYDQKAAEFIITAARGYPFFIQTWGSFAWMVFADSGEHAISKEIALKANLLALDSLDAGFFRSRMDRLTPKEKEFLIKMAQLEQPSIRTADIAEAMRCKSTSLSPIRARLIDKGVIYAPQYGEVAFTVPLFDDYLRRISN